MIVTIVWNYSILAIQNRVGSEGSNIIIYSTVKGKVALVEVLHCRGRCKNANSSCQDTQEAAEVHCYVLNCGTVLLQTARWISIMGLECLIWTDLSPS